MPPKATRDAEQNARFHWPVMLTAWGHEQTDVSGFDLRIQGTFSGMILTW